MMPILAEAASPAPAPTGGSAGGTLLWFLLASLAVIGLAFFATRALTRWQGFQSKGRRLRVLEGVPVGRDRYLMLVAVGKDLLVVGSSEGSISLVHRIEDPEAFLAQSVEMPAQAEGNASALEATIRGNLDQMRKLLTKLGGGKDA